MFNKSEIMRSAWAIARRFAGNGETLAQRLSRALKHVWWNAKQAARQVAAAAARAAAYSVAPKSRAQIVYALDMLEMRDRFTLADHAERARLQDELRHAIAA